MDDLIRRQDAIDVIDKIFPANPMKNEYTQGITCGAALATEYIKQLPSAQQWIPCSERLPEELLCDDGYVEPSSPVLICFSNGAVLISRYWGNRRSKIERPVDYLNWTDQPSWRQDPIAWMPLPEPYKAPEPERDCEHCVHHTDKGCSSWDCEYERRQ